PASFPKSVVACAHAHAAAGLVLVALLAAGHPPPLGHVTTDAAHHLRIPDFLQGVVLQRHWRFAVRNISALGNATDFGLSRGVNPQMSYRRILVTEGVRRQLELAI